MLLSKEDTPDTLQSLVDGSKEELEPGILDVSVVEGGSVRDGDSEQAEERSEEVVHPNNQRCLAEENPELLTYTKLTSGGWGLSLTAILETYIFLSPELPSDLRCI